MYVDISDMQVNADHLFTDVLGGPLPGPGEAFCVEIVEIVLLGRFPCFCPNSLRTKHSGSRNDRIFAASQRVESKDPERSTNQQKERAKMTCRLASIECIDPSGSATKPTCTLLKPDCLCKTKTIRLQYVLRHVVNLLKFHSVYTASILRYIKIIDILSICKHRRTLQQKLPSTQILSLSFLKLLWLPTRLHSKPHANAYWHLES